jgi:uncharacterized LabA/DUF88 family protein
VTERSKTVVMLIDWDNLQICHSRDAPGTDLDLNALIALAQSYGTLVSARAYAEWNLLSERLAVYKAGIEPVFAPVMRPENSPREGKSLADTVMVADGVDLLWTVTPDVFVLVTSDKDMIPLARIAKQRGAAVVVLGSDLTAIPLVEMSNVFITYRQLLRELDRVTELEAPSGRAPARERRLRETRRPSSEPYSGQSAIGPSGRGVGRPAGPAVALRAPQTALEAAPPRRLAEPVATVEAERPALSASAPVRSAMPTAPAPAAERSEYSALAPSDATPRRRRRRGGRGRRPDMPIGSDDDLTMGDQSVDSDDDVQTDDASEPTPPSNLSEARAEVAPDDLDTAVLELLAARDRQPESPVAEASPAVADAPAPPARTRTSSSRVAAGRTGVRRRATTTSFSDFGPSPSPRRRSEPGNAVEATPETPEPAVEAAAAVAAETPPPSADEARTAVWEGLTTPDDEAPLGLESEAAPDEPSIASAAPDTATAEGDATPAEVAPADAAVASVEPPLLDFPISTEASTGTEPSVETEQGTEAEAARPPVRRRRTRRPSTRATAEAASEAAAES